MSSARQGWEGFGDFFWLLGHDFSILVVGQTRRVVGDGVGKVCGCELVVVWVFF